jgi:hypothetical protein
MVRRIRVGGIALVIWTAWFHPGVASAWNGTGHMVVAKIAYDNLTEPAKQKLLAILKAHPDFERDFLMKVPQGIDAEAFAFMKAATWPDLVRSPRHPSHKYHRPKWHFIDYPINLGTTQGPDPQEEGGEVDNLLKAWKENLDALTQDATDPKGRAQALCWVLHLGGDVHQPLHCASLFSEQFPDGDRGGNLFLVRTTSGTIPLHTLWDHLLGNAVSPKILFYFAKTIQANPDFRPAALKAELTKTSVKDWARESYEKARDFAYEEGHLQGAVGDNDREANPPTAVPALPPNYERNATDLARQRIALAGYRLAATLNALLQQP